MWGLFITLIACAGYSMSMGPPGIGRFIGSLIVCGWIGYVTAKTV